MFNPLAKNFNRGVKTAFHLSREVFSGKNFLKRKVCFIFFGFRVERKGLRGEHLSTALLKFYITTQENKLIKISFVNYVFLIFLGDWAKEVWPLANFFRQVEQNCIQRVQTHFDRKNVFWKKSLFQFLTMIDELESFSGSFSGPVIETIFYVSRQCFAGIIFSLEKLSSKAFAEFERKKVGLSGKFSTRSSNLHCTSAKRIFWREFINLAVRNCFLFADTEIKFINPSAKFWSEA